MTEISEPAEDAPLEAWQSWTIQEGAATESDLATMETVGRRATKRANNWGKGVFFTREGFRNRKTELKGTTKKLKDEMSWTRW